MKKIVSLSIVLVLVSAVSFAQRPGDRFRHSYDRNVFLDGRFTKGEKSRLRKDQFRYQIAERNARRDGIITPMERRKLQKMKMQGRKDLYRYKHNGRKRHI